jgi:hypothetical protein
MLRAHQLMRKDVGKRLKKVLRRSPLGGEFYVSMDDGVIRRGRLDVLCLVYDVWGERVEKIWRAFFGFFWLFTWR